MRISLFVLSSVVACAGTTTVEHGEPSGSTCAPGSSLTYDGFGKTFMDKYCVECHASTLSATARQGAPSDHNFDTLANIREIEADHLDEMAAAGPDHVNTVMPPKEASAFPTEEERRQLGEWLACERP